MCENQWYQIQLFKKGKIEIFQNVWTHKVYDDQGNPGVLGIRIEHSSIQNQGLKTVSYRNFSECYDVKIIDDPNYEYKSEIPSDIEVIIHSTRKEEAHG